VERAERQAAHWHWQCREKNRAVVAVALKLAVLLLSLWKHGTDYEPCITTLVLTPA
jgi:hypothetical protein